MKTFFKINILVFILAAFTSILSAEEQGAKLVCVVAGTTDLNTQKTTVYDSEKAKKFGITSMTVYSDKIVNVDDVYSFLTVNSSGMSIFKDSDSNMLVALKMSRIKDPQQKYLEVIIAKPDKNLAVDLACKKQ